MGPALSARCGCQVLEEQKKKKEEEDGVVAVDIVHLLLPLARVLLAPPPPPPCSSSYCFPLRDEQQCSICKDYTHKHNTEDYTHRGIQDPVMRKEEFDCL